MNFTSISELNDFIYKINCIWNTWIYLQINLFSLMKIKKQIIFIKKKKLKRIIYHIWFNNYKCHIIHCYEFSYYHIIFINDDIIFLNNITLFWRLNNWNEDITILLFHINLKLIINIENIYLIIYIFNLSINNIFLYDIEYISQSNNSIIFSEKLCN